MGLTVSSSDQTYLYTSGRGTGTFRISIEGQELIELDTVTLKAQFPEDCPEVELVNVGTQQALPTEVYHTGTDKISINLDASRKPLESRDSATSTVTIQVCDNDEILGETEVELQG